MDNNFFHDQDEARTAFLQGDLKRAQELSRQVLGRELSDTDRQTAEALWHDIQDTLGTSEPAPMPSSVGQTMDLTDETITDDSAISFDDDEFEGFATGFGDDDSGAAASQSAAEDAFATFGVGQDSLSDDNFGAATSAFPDAPGPNDTASFDDDAFNETEYGDRPVGDVGSTSADDDDDIGFEEALDVSSHGNLPAMDSARFDSPVDPLDDDRPRPLDQMMSADPPLPHEAFDLDENIDGSGPFATPGEEPDEPVGFDFEDTPDAAGVSGERLDNSPPDSMILHMDEVTKAMPADEVATAAGVGTETLDFDLEVDESTPTAAPAAVSGDDDDEYGDDLAFAETDFEPTEGGGTRYESRTDVIMSERDVAERFAERDQDEESMFTVENRGEGQTIGSRNRDDDFHGIRVLEKQPEEVPTPSVAEQLFGQTAEMEAPLDEEMVYEAEDEEQHLPPLVEEEDPVRNPSRVMGDRKEALATALAEPPKAVSERSSMFDRLAAARATSPAAESYARTELALDVDYDPFIREPRAARSWRALFLALSLGAHPFKMLYVTLSLLAAFAICAGAVELLRLGIAEELTMTMVHGLFVPMGFLLYTILFALPSGLGHQTRAQMEGRIIPGPFKTTAFVWSQAQVALVWPFAIFALLAGAIWAWSAATDGLAQSAAASPILYVAALVLGIALFVLGIGAYLPGAIVGMGRARRLSGLTERFFRLLKYSLLTVLFYSFVLVIVTALASLILVGLHAVLVLSGGGLTSTAADGATTINLPDIAQGALHQLMVWLPPITDLMAMVGLDGALTVPITAGATGLAYGYLVVAAVLVGYSISTFFTGGTIAYILLRRRQARSESAAARSSAAA